MAPTSSMSCLVILSLWIRAPSNGNGGIWIGVHSNFWSVHRLSVICLDPRYSNHVLSDFFVPAALRFQYSDFTQSEYTICIPNETFLHCCFASQANSRTCIWYSFCAWDLWRFALPTLSYLMGHMFVSVSCHAVFRMAPSRHDLVDIWTRHILHVPPTTAELVIRH